MVAEGVGVSIVPEHCVTARYLKDLSIQPFGNPVLIRKVGFIERSDHQKKGFTDALFVLLQRSEMTKSQPLGDALNRQKIACPD